MNQSAYIIQLENALRSLIQAAEGPQVIVNGNMQSMNPALAQAKAVLNLPTGPPPICIVSAVSRD